MNEEITQKYIEIFLENFPEFKEAMETLLKVIVAALRPLIKVITEAFKTVFDNLPKEFHDYVLEQLKEEMKKNDRETKKTESREGKGRRTPD